MRKALIFVFVFMSMLTFSRCKKRDAEKRGENDEISFKYNGKEVKYGLLVSSVTGRNKICN